jgi:hypothetical protein
MATLMKLEKTFLATKVKESYFIASDGFSFLFPLQVERGTLMQLILDDSNQVKVKLFNGTVIDTTELTIRGRELFYKYLIADFLHLKLKSGTKEYYIEKIKEVLIDYGSFGMGEIDAESSIMVSAIGGIVHLIEYLSLEDLKVLVYDSNSSNCEPINEYYVNYEDLSLRVLKAMWDASKEYRKQQEDLNF